MLISLLILFNENVFGVQMIFFALRFNQGVRSNGTFALIVLLLSTLASFIASVDHTELCFQAIAVIVYWSVLIVHGMYYMHMQRMLMFSAQKPFSNSDFINLILMYLKLIAICVFDWFYYGYENKEWYLLCCFVCFLEPIETKIKAWIFGVYLVFFTVGFAFDEQRPFSYWMLYLAFVLVIGFLVACEIPEKRTWIDSFIQ